MDASTLHPECTLGRQTPVCRQLGHEAAFRADQGLRTRHGHRRLGNVVLSASLSGGRQWPTTVCCGHLSQMDTPQSFIYVDRMFRPYVLTKLRDAAGLWEYTRYLAESNAVITVGAPEFFDDFPVPVEAEYEGPEEPGIEDTTSEGTHTGDASPSKDTRVRSMLEAVDAIRGRRFSDAIQYLETLVQDRPNYHVGWLRLGYARRELAVDIRQKTGSDAMSHQRELLELSLESLNKAKNHIGRQYKAEACYQASKTYYRLWLIEQTGTTLDKALEQGSDASATYPDSKYESWFEYLSNVQAV